MEEEILMQTNILTLIYILIFNDPKLKLKTSFQVSLLTFVVS